MAKIKKIGVLTSGGDAPGMNAAIRAITDKAIEQGLEVVAVLGGYSGLIDDKIVPMTMEKVNGIITRGGTCIYSNRCPEFATEAGMQKAIATCKKNNIDAIVAIGGDGTFRGATDLSLHGIPTVGVAWGYGKVEDMVSAGAASIAYTMDELYDALMK